MTFSPDFAGTTARPSENGVPDDGADSIRWPTRPGLAFNEHLRALHKAIGEGSRIRGYYAWSLLDSFEWTAGYSQRWGIVRVDFDTLARSPKASASWYASAAASNSVPAE